VPQRDSKLKLCIIGNSHIASLKQGWEKIQSDHPDINIRFFGSPGSSINRLKTNKSSLISTDNDLLQNLRLTSGGLSEIDTDSYDAFVSYGLSFEIDPLDVRLSSALVDAFCQQQAREHPNYRLIKKIQSISNKPIFIGHAPLLADIGPIAPSPHIPYRKLFSKISDYLAMESIKMLRQPDSTIIHEIRTIAHFTVGSTRLLHGPGSTTAMHHDDNDVKHMNGEFGAVYLDAAITTIRSALRDQQIEVESPDVSAFNATNY